MVKSGSMSCFRWSSDIGSPSECEWPSDIGSPSEREWSPDIGSPAEREWSSDIGSPSEREWSSDIGSPSECEGSSDIGSPSERKFQNQPVNRCAQKNSIFFELIRCFGVSSRKEITPMKRDDENRKKDDRYIFGIKLSRKDKAKWLAHFKREAKRAKALYKGEAKSVESLHKMFEEGGLNICPCGGRNFSRKYGKRNAKCLSCKRVSSITARMPFFKGVKLLDIHLCMLHLIDSGCIFNAYQFSLEMKVSYDTAWNLMRKVEFAMLIAQRNDKNCQSIDSRHMVELYMRRSIATPAFKEPAAEQQAMEDLHTSNQNQEQQHHQQQRDQKAATEADLNRENETDERCAEEAEEAGETEETEEAEKAKETEENEDDAKCSPEGSADEPSGAKSIIDVITDLSSSTARDTTSDSENGLENLTELQRQVYNTSSSEPATFDALVNQLNASVNEINAALTILELEGLINKLPGNRYIRANITPPASIQPAQNTYNEKMIEQINTFREIIQINNQGVSRKYANLHLANINRLYKQTFDPEPFSIFEICAHLNEIGRSEVRNYISGLSVEIVMPAVA
jgi:hypothetical protein